jgi:hypothetical protein
MGLPLGAIASRAAAGSYLVRTGLETWSGSEARARELHATASNIVPPVQRMSPDMLLKVVAAGQVSLGAALLLPTPPSRLARVGLAAGLAALAARSQANP